MDLLDGFRERRTSARRIEVLNVNFVQDRGVRAGANRLTFGVEQLGASRVRSVRILADSGITISTEGPAALTVRAAATPTAVRTGEWFNLRAVVRNPSSRTAREVGVAAEFDEDALEAKGAPGRPLPDLAPGTAAAATFRLRALSTTPLRVVAVARSASDSSTASVRVRVREADELTPLERIGRITILAVVFLPALLVLVLPPLWRRARRP